MPNFMSMTKAIQRRKQQRRIAKSKLIDSRHFRFLTSSFPHRIALMVHDYHDLCQGSYNNPNGITNLNMRLLAKSGYQVLSVPYHEFSISDKLLKRVQYLEKLIKAATKQ